MAQDIIGGTMLNKLTEMSLTFRGLIVILIIGVAGFGIYRYREMPVDAFPDISPIMVSTRVMQQRMHILLINVHT